MPRVELLSDALINKIAAGEVVERPASVVKELCENALDAGAKVIRVQVEEGGLGRIRIQDDGSGMDREDARLAIERHATSKLRDLEGLFNIETMGFRGEALASIAAVSRFSLTTAERAASVGTRIEVEGGGHPLVQDAPPMEGTLIEVADLFFNVPARRKYMKRSETEVRHIEDAVLRLALAHPEVAFFLNHGERELLASPAAGRDLRERIAAAMGPEVHPHLLEVSERRLGLSVHGQVASPEFTRNNARGLFTFVNRRYIRDRNLNYSIQRAFSPLLAPGRQPVGVVFIEMDPHAVDVNVHPQKMEVRFVDAREVGDAVHAAISRAIKSVPWLAAGGTPAGTGPTPEAAQYAHAVDRFLARAQGEPGAPGGVSLSSPFLLAEDAPLAPAFGQARPDRNAAPAPGFFRGLRYVGAVGRRFWVCEGAGGTLVVLDSHAAFERIAHDAFVRAFERRLAEPELPRGTLFSAQLELTAEEAAKVLGRTEALRTLGFEVSDFGGSSVAVTALPDELLGADLRSLLLELLPLVPVGGFAGGAGAQRALEAMACRAAELGLREHGHDEVRKTLEQLEAVPAARGCRHGSVVLEETPFLELQRRANAKV